MQIVLSILCYNITYLFRKVNNLKKALKILLIIGLSLLILFLFNTLNSIYPGNIISRILRGFSVVLTPVLIALVILYLVNPMTKRMINSGKFSKRFAIVLTMIIVIAVILLIFGLVGWFFVDQGLKLYDIITEPSFLGNIKDWFYNNNIGDIYDWFENFIVNFEFTKYLGSVNSVVTVIFQTVTSIILVPIFLWHFLNSSDVIYGKIQENIPVGWRKNVIPILNDSNEVIVSYFRSKLLSMFVLFVMFLFVYLFLGVPIKFVLFFALLISLLDLIPYLGPTVGLVVPIIYLFSAGGANLMYSNTWHVNAIIATIILVGINTIIQFIQGNIIIPKLAGKEMQINSAIILVFMLFFGYILGIWGIVLSIPLGGILLVFWKHLKESGYFNSTNEPKQLNNETEK